VSHYTVTAKPYLRVRSGAGTSYAEIGRLPEGTRVSVLERRGSWAKVETTAHRGWVHGDYLSAAALTIEVDMIPRGSSNRTGAPLVPKFVTIHNTANPSRGADALMHARYLKGGDAHERRVSWHYTVDDQRVIQHLPDNERGMHAGTRAGNALSLGVEICENVGINEDAAVDLAARLVAEICRRHGIPADATGVRTHQSWSGKVCPRVLLTRPGGFAAFLKLVARYA
jgi:N-acetylmuramoyl-L-alanine amidase